MMVELFVPDRQIIDDKIIDFLPQASWLVGWFGTETDSINIFPV